MLKTPNILLFFRRTSALLVDIFIVLLVSLIIWAGFCAIKNPQGFVDAVHDTYKGVNESFFVAAIPYSDYEIYQKKWNEFLLGKVQPDYFHLITTDRVLRKIVITRLVQPVWDNDRLKLFIVFIFILYNTLCIASRWQATVGMRVLNIYVENTEPQKPASLKQCFFRVILLLLIALPLSGIFIVPKPAISYSHLQNTEQSYRELYLTTEDDITKDIEECKRGSKNLETEKRCIQIQQQYKAGLDIDNSLHLYDSLRRWMYLGIIKNRNDEAQLRKIYSNIPPTNEAGINYPGILDFPKNDIVRTIVERTITEQKSIQLKYYSVILLLCFWFIILFMLFNRNSQAVHDVICKTRMVRGRSV